MDYLEEDDEAMNIINDIPTPLWRDIVCKIKRSAEVDIVRAALGTLQIEKNEVRISIYWRDIALFTLSLLLVTIMTPTCY